MQRYSPLLLAALIAGCTGSPARIAAPKVDADEAASAAVQRHDANGDGVLSDDELEACPGIRVNLSLYDQNGDGRVGQDEIANRLRELYEKRVGLTQLTGKVLFQGRPLADATVVLEPEAHLATAIHTAQGTTNAQGVAALTIPPESIPDALRNRKVVQFGTYKVRITHPSIKLPSKYNTNTTLGYETQLGNPFATFNLQAN